MERQAVIAVAVLGALLAIAPGARADTNCISTYSTLQTITGNLNVPDNATCIRRWCVRDRQYDRRQWRHFDNLRRDSCWQRSRQ